MKHTPSLKKQAASHAKQSGRNIRPRRCSRELIVELICFLVFSVLSGTLAHGQEGHDALFIDKDGNVTVGKNLKADKFEGDGSAITVKAAEGEKSLRITEEQLKCVL